MQERRIGDIAIDAIDWIMDNEPVQKRIGDYTIARNATFSDVMQYLWTYVGNGAPINNPNNYARYRIGRYKSALSQVPLGQEQIHHIDLGCGGGTFTHALLELCQVSGVAFDKVALYGYDHTPEMIKAARIIHQFIGAHHRGSESIPNLYAYSGYEAMLETIPAGSSEPTRYIITAGYVLANNLDRQMTEEFTAIIKTVVNKAGNHPCSLIVQDANTVRELASAYDRLVESLQANGVNVRTQRNTRGLRIAGLQLQGVRE